MITMSRKKKVKKCMTSATLAICSFLQNHGNLTSMPNLNDKSLIRFNIWISRRGEHHQASVRLVTLKWCMHDFMKRTCQKYPTLTHYGRVQSLGGGMHLPHDNRWRRCNTTYCHPPRSQGKKILLCLFISLVFPSLVGCIPRLLFKKFLYNNCIQPVVTML